MNLSSALLCDFASVREGLLYVLSGGITRVWRTELPAPLGISVALVLELEPWELDTRHGLHVAVENDEHEKLVQADGEFQAAAPPDEAPDLQLVPFALDFRNAPVNGFGRYSVEVQIDGTPLRSLPFYVMAPPGS